MQFEIQNSIQSNQQKSRQFALLLINIEQTTSTTNLYTFSDEHMCVLLDSIQFISIVGGIQRWKWIEFIDWFRIYSRLFFLLVGCGVDSSSTSVGCVVVRCFVNGNIYLSTNIFAIVDLVSMICLNDNNVRRSMNIFLFLQIYANYRWNSVSYLLHSSTRHLVVAYKAFIFTFNYVFSISSTLHIFHSPMWHLTFRVRCRICFSFSYLRSYSILSFIFDTVYFTL